jgi:NADH-quinone oxidoreductase subunit F
MDIDEVRAAAESESSYLNDKACIRIFVASEAKDPCAVPVLSTCEAATGNESLQARVIRTGSCGCRDLEPVLIIESTGRPSVLYNNVTPDTALDLIKSFVAQDAAGCIPHISHLPFSPQNRITLRNCGWIDPENINHYIVRGSGYAGLWRALHVMGPQLGKLIPSAMRGRGGPGFSTAAGIQKCSESSGDKYVVCNAVGAGPGASPSKLLLESDPHSVLEGMLISACALGASRCIIYVNAGRGLSERLGKALEQMRKYNLLGCGILDSGFDAEIEIEEVPDSLVSIHRSELLRCTDEPQPMPNVRPTYPGNERFAAGPAAIFNPEIMAALSGILPDAVEERKGTKIVTLSGSVVHRHTAEVPFGTPIRSIIDTVGGGTESGKQIKAVQLGGPAGVLIHASEIDLEVGCGKPEESHSNVGSGEIQVFDSDSSAAGIAGAIIASLRDQSCGRCLLCLEGSRQVSNILSDITDGRGTPQDLNLSIELGEEMRAGCGCAFGRSAAEQFLSSLKFFRNEWFPV